MKRKAIVKIISGIFIFCLLVVLLMVIVVQPWIEKKIFSALENANSNYTITVNEINTLFLPPGLELNGVTIHSKINRGVNAEIESIKFKRIKIGKLIFRNDWDVGEAVVLNSVISGKVSFERVKHIISSLNIRIKKIFFDGIDLEIQSTSSSGSWSVKNGFITLYDFELMKKDTLFIRPSGPFDLKVEQILRVSPDSFYTFKLDKIVCSAKSNSLQAEAFSVQPNHKDYDFTSRHEFQTDCVEAIFSNISLANFSPADYFEASTLSSSRIEIDSMDINVFRDRRKKFQHKKKPMLQDILYDYPGRIKIDTVRVVNGNVAYTEHGENAKEPGRIYFKKVGAEIFNVTNDTIYKAQKSYVQMKCEALLMGTAKFGFSLKAQLFDSTGTFALTGGLSKMDVRDLNPILERNAFIHAESGNIDTMSFSFTANDYASSGEMTLLYNILFVKAEGEYAVVPASLFQLLVSSITSKKIIDANPVPGKKVRTGVIAFQRDPEKFVFNYYYKSILSGIKSTIAKNPDINSKL